MVTLYHTLIEPYLQYYNIVWASQNNIHLQKLFFKQKKAVTILANAKWDAHTQPIFYELNLMTIVSINRFQTFCFMYKVSRGLVPTFFLTWFVENKSVHDHYTRQSAYLHVAQYRTIARALDIKIFGVKLWNDFVSSKLCNVSIAHSFSIFKSKCKTYVINEQRMWFDRTDYFMTNSIKFNIFLCLFFFFNAQKSAYDVILSVYPYIKFV